MTSVTDSKKTATDGRGGRPEGVQKLNLMLTESCNLDCWMCDFGKRNKRMKRLPLSPDEILTLLQHPVFADTLKSLTLTGGEPFMYPDIEELYLALRDRRPDLKVNFSSNTTLLSKMTKVFDHVRDWQKVSLFVSIDGIEKHDEQRGKDGSFELTFGNIEALRARYPSLGIQVKFTITPVNYMELEKTFQFFQSRNYRITAKMVENNPNYTNNLSFQRHIADFGFKPDQLESVRTQLRSIIKAWPRAKDRRRLEVDEVLESLEPKWRRPDRCQTPQKGGFIDCDLNFFSCKEYGAVLNLKTQDLSEREASPGYKLVVENEKCNAGQCTHCTSLLKMREQKKESWPGYLVSLIR